MVASRPGPQKALTKLLGGLTSWPQTCFWRTTVAQRFDQAQLPTPRKVRDWNPLSCGLDPYARCERYGGEAAEDLFRRGICLPSSSSLTEEDQLRVVNAARRTAGMGELNELRRIQPECMAVARD